MKAAYDMMDVYNSALEIEKMKDELSKMPAYDKDLPVVPTYDEKLKHANDTIRDSKLLNDFLPDTNGMNTGDLLRQELKNTLTDPDRGLLNKKIFTAQDRQAAEDALAKAVILSMIRSGRTVAATSTIESAYQKEPKETMDLIKESAAFQNAKNKFITPDGLRNFLTEHREVTVNKELQERFKENNDLQKQSHSKVEPNLRLQQGRQPQPVPEPPKKNAPELL